MSSAASESAEAVALELDTGAWCVLQRVPAGTDADAFASALSDRISAECRQVEDVDFSGQVGPVRLLDARRRVRPRDYAGWDPGRSSLAGPDRPLVVLLNVPASLALLRGAPQVASWAGGVRLPAEPHVRATETDAEEQLGRRKLRTRLHQDPELAERLQGLTFAVELSTGRIFTPSPDSVALLVAAENLDQGVVYVTRLEDEELT